MKINILVYNKIHMQQKTNFLQKCLCVNNIAYFVVIVGIIIMVTCGAFLSKRLGHVKEQLDSCRSSMRGD